MAGANFILIATSPQLRLFQLRTIISEVMTLAHCYAPLCVPRPATPNYDFIDGVISFLVDGSVETFTPISWDIWNVASSLNLHEFRGNELAFKGDPSLMKFLDVHLRQLSAYAEATRANGAKDVDVHQSLELARDMGRALFSVYSQLGLGPDVVGLVREKLTGADGFLMHLCLSGMLISTKHKAGIA